MPLSFFVPSSKVHKQRNLMRETDSRLAHYSLRGIALSIIVFVISLALGGFYEKAPQMALIYAVGILLFTALRAYFLFRFDIIYPRAPERWRNIYFTVTLVGATWWGIMLANVTYTVGMGSETPLLWLYTIAFFSSCSHVLSPFTRFYSTYLLVSMLPASIIAMLSLQSLESLYGLILLILFFMMRKQGNTQGNSYWEKLQATYDLTQRANALQAEKISSESSMSNKDTLFMNLAGELKTSLREIMGSLQLLTLSKLPEQEEQLVDLTVQKSQQQMHMLQNILEFSHISRKEVVLNDHVFDLRAIVEKAVGSISDRLYKQSIEVFSRFSSEFPLRVRGDSERIEQILVNIMISAIDYTNKGSVLIDANYLEGIDKVGTLKVVVDIDQPFRNPEIEQQLHDAFKPHYASNMSQGLSLAIAKGLANCMQGNAGANYTGDEHLKFWFTIVLPVVTPANKETQHLAKSIGKRLLVFQPPKIIETEYRDNLESWGFTVDIIYDYQEALEKATQKQGDNNIYDLILIYTRIDDFSGFELSQSINKHAGKSLSQILCLTDTQNKLSEVVEFIDTNMHIETLIKPVRYKALRQRLKNTLINDDTTSTEAINETLLKDKRVLLYQKEEIDKTIAEVMLKKLGCEVITVKTAEEITEQAQLSALDAFITESHIEGVEDIKAFFNTITTANIQHHEDGYVLPILGLSHHEEDGEETHCLQSGMNYYIELPLQIDDLRAILRRWIGRAKHLAETAQNEKDKPN